MKLFTPEECASIVAAFDAYPNKNNESAQEAYYKDSVGVNNLPETLYYVSEFTKQVQQFFPYAKFSNTYTRCYNKGSYLGIHTDRVGLDLTVSVCLENKGGYKWPLYVSNKQHQGAWSPDTDGSPYKESAAAMYADVGEGVAVEGRKHPHWRDPFDCKDGERTVYVFYHWTLEEGRKVASVEAANSTKDVSFSIKNPDAYVIDDFMTASECEAIIALARERLVQSTVVDNNTGAPVTHENRTSRGMFFKRAETPLIEEIERRISERVGIPTERGEGLQVLRYDVGQEYKPHNDYFAVDSPGAASHLAYGGQRVSTFIVYLNTPELGGATCFPDVGLEVAARKGRALVFSYDKPDASSKTLHGGMPVLKGEKWVITKWFREGRFDK